MGRKQPDSGEQLSVDAATLVTVGFRVPLWCRRALEEDAHQRGVKASTLYRGIFEAYAKRGKKKATAKKKAAVPSGGKGVPDLTTHTSSKPLFGDSDDDE